MIRTYVVSLVLGAFALAALAPSAQAQEPFPDACPVIDGSPQDYGVGCANYLVTNAASIVFRNADALAEYEQSYNTALVGYQTNQTNIAYSWANDEVLGSGLAQAHGARDMEVQWATETREVVEDGHDVAIAYLLEWSDNYTSTQVQPFLTNAGPVTFAYESAVNQWIGCWLLVGGCGALDGPATGAVPLATSYGFAVQQWFNCFKAFQCALTDAPEPPVAEGQQYVEGLAAPYGTPEQPSTLEDPGHEEPTGPPVPCQLAQPPAPCVSLEAPGDPGLSTQAPIPNYEDIPEPDL